MPSCRQCSAPFEVAEQDTALLAQIAPVFGGKTYPIPTPDLCPPCRQRKRICWRNERSIYRRTCDLCKRPVISAYAPDASVIAYCPSCFWSDGWDQYATGRDFDFSRPFFGQFDELQRTAPLLGLINMNTENSEYCHRIFDGRNNYLSYIMLFGSENMLHSYYTMTCKDCCDVSQSDKLQLCYEMEDGKTCYGCSFCTRTRNCSDCWFCEDCTGCKNCYGCKNLRQKEYCVFNQQKTKEEYEAFLSGRDFGSRMTLEKMREEARTFFLTQPYRAVISINCENCVGANMFDCKDCFEIYDFYESERMRYCTLGERSHDCLDCFGFGVSEFCYECTGFNYANRNIFCAECMPASFCAYSCNLYNNAANCFGCVGLKKASYCILNKQYSKEEYEALVPRIIEHMMATDEWGHFFPTSVAPYGYNETVAQDCFPMKKEEAVALGFRWRDQDPKEYGPATVAVPDHIRDVTDALTKETLACVLCTKNYRIVAQELAFYRSRGLPVPAECPDCRHARRMQARPPRHLWNRPCMKCTKEMQTTYSPDRPEIVYCEECYLKEVY